MFANTNAFYPLVYVVQSSIHIYIYQFGNIIPVNDLHKLAFCRSGNFVVNTRCCDQITSKPTGNWFDCSSIVRYIYINIYIYMIWMTMEKSFMKRVPWFIDCSTATCASLNFASPHPQPDCSLNHGEFTIHPVTMSAILSASCHSMPSSDNDIHFTYNIYIPMCFSVSTKQTCGTTFRLDALGTAGYWEIREVKDVNIW